jgi:hypothetical protein
MKNIKGKVIDKQGNPVYGAKVFLSDISGKITPSKIGSITDFDGYFELKIPEKNDGTHLTATSLDGGRNTQRYEPNNEKYEFDLSFSQTQNLQEVTVTANRPIDDKIKEKPVINVDTSKYKKRIKIALIILGSIIVLGATIYIIKKNKTVPQK